MFRTMHFIVGIMYLLSAIGCSKSKAELEPEPTPDPPRISISPTSKTIEPKGETFTVNVTSNRKWNITHLPIWLSSSESSGEENGKTSLTCNPIHETTSRNDSVVFKAENVTTRLLVTQKGEPVTLFLDREKETVPATAGFVEVTVTTNGKTWTTSGVPEWITLAPESSSTSGTVKVSYDANNTGKERKATVNFSAGEAAQTLTITQLTLDTIISISQIPENVSAFSGSIELELTITSGVSWNTSNVPEWITLSPANGTGSQNVILTYEANTIPESRNASITFFSGSKTHTLNITQAAAATTISIDKTNENVTASSGSMNINVTTNSATWNTSGIPEWITLSPTSGNGSQSVALTYKANMTTDGRSATITFTAGNESTTLHITQAAAAATISIDKTNENITASSGSMSINVTTNGATWNISGIPEWITLSPTSGNGSQSVALTYKANMTTDGRSATITFTAGNESTTLHITQAAATATISIDKTNENVPASSGSMNINVTTNGATWNTSGIPEWITLSPTSGTGNQSVTLTYKANTTTNGRNATITFTAGNESRTLHITQAATAATISIDKTNESVSASGAWLNVDVTTNDATWNTSGIPDWITLSPTSGKGSQNVGVTCEPNTINTSRSATITFTAGEKSCILHITQAAAAATISIDKTNENVPASAGSININVTTNGATWNTSGIPEWITLSPTSGNGSQSVTLTYQANTTTNDRSATITFMAGNTSNTLYITQAAAAATISIDKTNENVLASAGSININVTTNGTTWNTSGIPEWITLSPASGNGSLSVTLTYKVNTTGASRSATIIFSSGDKSCSFNITQAQNNILEIVKTDYSVKSTGGTVEVTLQANITYAVAIDVNWITVIDARSVTEQTRQFSIKANDSKEKRTGHITFSGAGISRTVTIEQSESGDVLVDIKDWDDDGHNHGGTAE